jgi:mannose-6-phosphate isomerase-like protein (cupin superfamily)
VADAAAHPFDVDATRLALLERGGGYEVVHSSPGLEIGVYVLVVPEPDRQQPHDEDEVYVVLEGSGVLEVEGTATPLSEGMALFVPAGAEHRFTSYEQLALLVVFNGLHSG